MGAAIAARCVGRGTGYTVPVSVIACDNCTLLDTSTSATSVFCEVPVCLGFLMCRLGGRYRAAKAHATSHGFCLWKVPPTSPKGHEHRAHPGSCPGLRLGQLEATGQLQVRSATTQTELAAD